MSKPELIDRVETKPVGDELSEEELGKIKADVDKLLKNNPALQAAASSLLLSHRIHSTALAHLQREAQRQKLDERVPMFVARAMQHQAKTLFDRREVLEQLSQTTLPWLSAEVHDALRREGQLAEADAERREKQRVNRGIPLPFFLYFGWPVDKEKGGPAALPRAQAVSAAGRSSLVRCFLDQLEQRALAASLTVLRFVESLSENQLSRKNQPAVRVGPNHWMQTAVKPSRLTALLHTAAKSLVGEKIDLLLIESPLGLYDDFDSEVHGVEQQAAHALKNLRKAAATAGCGLVVGVPYNESWSAWQENTGWRALMQYTLCLQLRPGDEPDGTPSIEMRRLGEDGAWLLHGFPRNERTLT